MQNLNEKTKYERKLKERKPTNYPFNLRTDKLVAPDTYKEDFNYCIILVDPNTQEPIDIRIVKTTETLENFIKDKHERHNLDILFHLNPIKLEADFWKEYRKTKNGAERLKLFADQKVLADSNMLFIDTIVIDIDSPFKEALKVLNELTKELNIPAEILEIRKTKSGNLRFSFSIKPITPNKLNKNGQTNLQNTKEFVSIINNYFKKHNLKADDSFKRINHPVWITKPEEVAFEATEEINFYTLYNKAKKLNKKLKEEQKQKKKKKEQKPKRRLVYLPAFMANKFRQIEQKTALEKAVETLARRNKKGRYIHFLQPVAGWCKYLNLDYYEYYDLVYPYVRNKKDSRTDIKKAWRYARPIEFKAYTEERKYDLVEYADKVINYLKKKGATERQILLKEVFDNQKWLEQLIMQELKEQGIIKEWFEKQEGGKGRPKKVYQVKENENKDTKNDKKESTEKKDFYAKNGDKRIMTGFSQVYNLPLGSILEVVGNSFRNFYNFSPLSRNLRIFKFSKDTEIIKISYIEKISTKVEIEKKEKILIDTS